MIKKYTFGNPIETQAVVKKIELSSESIKDGKTFTDKNNFNFFYKMDIDDQIFGLGENVRGINKRGFSYTSWCLDNPNQGEYSNSLYAAHNFIIIKSKKTFGIFFDTPQKITFDLGFTKCDEIKITSSPDIDLYFIYPEENAENIFYNIIKQFRQLIGKSYLAPLWAFGYLQSRWGYKTKDDVLKVIECHKKNKIPLEGICLDIDYMVDYKDFSVDEKKFPDFKNFVSDLKKEGIYLVPIIDAGIKVQEGYEVYEEGCKNNYFCKKENGENFIGGVWPGRSVFPDFLNKDVREWFGKKYKILTDNGIEGFWNDMNEPALFYGEDNLKNVFEKLSEFKNKNIDLSNYFAMGDLVRNMSNNEEDYKSFYHNQTLSDGTVKNIRHDKVHNIYGTNMTRSASEGLNLIDSDKRFLLFSRASSIGSHRYGGIWTGDNGSTWSHLQMGFKMMPSLNMCGFLFCGTDTGGFGCNTSRDLLLRWLSFSIYTPLMRNHSALGSREQECYQFENTEDFASIISLRYHLLPYIYSEYMKASLNDTMLFKPFAFEWPEDKRACHTEDQLLFGESLMIAPVMEQNAFGRMIYLPEEMTLVRWSKNKITETKNLSSGDYFIEVPLNEVVFFIRKNSLLPFAKKDAFNSSQVNFNDLELLGNGNEYVLYKDDGKSKKVNFDKNITLLKK